MTFYLPPGGQDRWGDILTTLRASEKTFLQTLDTYGYIEVATPIMEDLCLISQADPRLEQQGMVKVIGAGGQILTLRPDMTVPIARMISTHFRQVASPLRLGYWSPVYRSPMVHDGDETEFIQAGAELVGAQGPQADAEVIAMAIDSLLALGLDDFLIEIGQVQILRSIIKELGATYEQQEQIRNLIHSKNVGELIMLLERIGTPQHQRDTLSAIPMLYGTPARVLSDLSMLVSTDGMQEAMEGLVQMVAVLEDYGMGHHLRLDLGLVPDLTYYTGVVFRGLVREMGYPIVSGGRYDTLFKEFEMDLPATGFAVHMGRVTKVLWRRQQLMRQSLPIYILAKPEFRREGRQLACSLRKAARPVIMDCHQVLGPDDQVVELEARGVIWRHLGQKLRFMDTDVFQAFLAERDGCR